MKLHKTLLVSNVVESGSLRVLVKLENTNILEKKNEEES